MNSGNEFFIRLGKLCFGHTNSSETTNGRLVRHTTSVAVTQSPNDGNNKCKPECAMIIIFKGTFELTCIYIRLSSEVLLGLT